MFAAQRERERERQRETKTERQRQRVVLFNSMKTDRH